MTKRFGDLTPDERSAYILRLIERIKQAEAQERKSLERMKELTR